MIIILTYFKAILVPYKRHHVLKYHDWMSNKEIQELTSSEPLSLEEEYEMQQTWLNDEDKLTFIVLDRRLYESISNENEQEREICAMVGDVNIFLLSPDDNDMVEESADLKNIAELEIMIADKAFRGKGLGIEAIYLMMNYALQHLKSPPLKKFIVKIDDTNTPSIKMFEKLGFSQFNYSAVFKQISLKLEINENFYSNDSNQNPTDYTKFYKDFILNIELHE